MWWPEEDSNKCSEVEDVPLPKSFFLSQDSRFDEATTLSMVQGTVGRPQVRLIFEESWSTERRKGQ